MASRKASTASGSLRSLARVLFLNLIGPSYGGAQGGSDLGDGTAWTVRLVDEVHPHEEFLSRGQPFQCFGDPLPLVLPQPRLNGKSGS